MSLSQLHSLPPAQQQEILNGPALEPPSPDIIPNLENPPNGNVIALATVTICLSVATISALLRAYARIFVSRKVNLEDYIAFIGYSLGVAFAYSGYRLYLGTGFFVHQWNVKVKDLAEFLFTVYLGSAFYSIAVMSLKVAILLEWTRTFAPRGARGFFYHACLVLIGLNVSFYSSSFLVENLSCFPHNGIWDKTIPARCINHKALDLSSATINLASHLLILILPQWVIWKLNMTRRKKIGVSLIFAVGILTVIAGTFRLATTVQYYLSPDITYRVSSLSLWALAEVTLLVLVFSMPAFPSLFVKRTASSKGSSTMPAWVGGFSKRSQSKASDSHWSASKERLTTIVSSPHKAGNGAIRMDDLVSSQTLRNPTSLDRASPAQAPGPANRIYYTREFQTTEERVGNLR
ncbi:hypothetical protein F5Y10DRAFT_240288 [Nemania abortiva]|nr:hypothetical protein F5Y10DRAFT_240288 [Nemania abortiva]